jgi:hypothetical protein
MRERRYLDPLYAAVHSVSGAFDSQFPAISWMHRKIKVSVNLQVRKPAPQMVLNTQTD